MSSTTPPSSTNPKAEPTVKIQDLSCGEFKLHTAYSIATIPKSPKVYDRPCFKMEPKEIFKVPPKIVFIKWGDLSKEDLVDITGWLYKEMANLPPLPVKKYGKGYDMMKAKGYDGTSGLGKNKTGRREPIEPVKKPKYLGLGYGFLDNDDRRTNGILSERVHASESVKTTKETFTETDSQEWEFSSERSLSDYCLNDLFVKMGELTSEQKIWQTFKIDQTPNSQNPSTLPQDIQDSPFESH